MLEEARIRHYTSHQRFNVAALQKSPRDAMKTLPTRTLLATLLCLPGLALADISGTYQMGRDDGTLTIRYKDDQHIRFDFHSKETGEPAAYLLTDKGLYALMPDGQYMDMESLGAMSRNSPTPMGEKAAKPPKIEPTGRKQTIAGIEGEVYTWADEEDSGEMVLSSSDKARQLMRAWMIYSERLVKALGGADDMNDLKAMQKDKHLKDKGFLAVSSKTEGEQMRLMKVEEGKLADSLFVLKGAPMALPGMGTPAAGAKPAQGMPDMSDPAIQEMMRKMMEQQGR